MMTTKKNSVPDLILVDKPKGISSFDCIRRLKRAFSRLGVSAPKMGHAGTLDPMASGLLIVGIGKGTKELHRLLGLPKSYEARVLLGLETDTLDLEGRPLREARVEHLSSEDIRKAFLGLEGVHTVPVPLYSAVKKEGKPLYWYARQGKRVDVPLKEMHVLKVEVGDIIDVPGGKKEILVEFDVSSGTYIRSLAEEAGRRLEVPAVLSSLRRTEIGDFSVNDAPLLEKWTNRLSDALQYSQQR